MLMKTVLTRFITFFLFIVCLPLLTGCASTKTIVNGLDEKEANEILVFLASKNVDAMKAPSKDTGGAGASKLVLWDIDVPSNQANEAMALLNQAGLPRRKSQNLLNIFAAGGLVPSELQEKIRYQAGLAEQIASTIRKIDGILDTEVQISFPEEDPLHPEINKTKKITASVYVKHSGVLDDPNSHLITKIKRLVAASITGLDYDNVTVIADRARYGGNIGLESASADEPKQYVSVWTIVLAQESVNRFRIIFFSFVMFSLLLLLSLVWVLWKVIPVLSHHGGIKELFTFHAINTEPQVAKEEKEKAEEHKEKTEKEAEKKEEPTDKNIDVT